jgi:hypothetical protein
MSFSENAVGLSPLCKPVQCLPIHGIPLAGALETEDDIAGMQFDE